MAVAARRAARRKRALTLKIITGHKAEAWTDEDNTVYMATDLPQKAPCEGVGGLSRQDQTATVNVDLTPGRQRACAQGGGRRSRG